MDETEYLVRKPFASKHTDNEPLEGQGGERGTRWRGAESGSHTPVQRDGGMRQDPYANAALRSSQSLSTNLDLTVFHCISRTLVLESVGL